MIHKIEYALTFMGKTVYASEHNFADESRSSVIDGVEIRKSYDFGDRDEVKISLTNHDDDDYSYWLDIKDFNKTWFMTKDELKKYWKDRETERSD